MKETITLNQKEQARLRVLNLVLAGVCTLPRAAELLGVSEPGEADETAVPARWAVGDCPR